MAPKKKPKNKKKQRALNEGEFFIVCFYLAKNSFAFHETEKLDKGTSPTLMESRMENRQERKGRAVIIWNNFRFMEKLQR